MSEPDIELVLTAINDLRQSNNETHGAIKDTLTAGLHGLQLKIETDNTLLNQAIEQVNQVLMGQNDRLQRLEDGQGEAREKLRNFDRHVRFFQGLKKRWYMAAIGLILAFSALNFLYDTGWLRKIFDFLIKKL
jgi:hypothetical protein